MAKALGLDDYLHGLKNQDRGILAKAISLIESSKSEDQLLAKKLLAQLVKARTKSFRIGITGIPGAGKSTFINQLGSLYCDHEFLTAVLTIDPSSTKSGGSILGDKTRMQELSFRTNAFIRPSPSLGHLGGVAARTRETILLCEAFGFERILIESVGVGQSEQEISSLCDLTILLSISGAGDDLQGIKRGLLEAADWILVNKADGENLARAEKTKQELLMALKILKHEDVVVDCVSSLKKDHVAAVYHRLEDYFHKNKKEIADRRRKQNIHWFEKLVEQELLFQFRNNKDLQDKIQKIKDEILSGAHPLNKIMDLKLN